jgi:hypothetical protein
MDSVTYYDSVSLMHMSKCVQAALRFHTNQRTQRGKQRLLGNDIYQGTPHGIDG